jgi:hypothetical protein
MPRAEELRKSLVATRRRIAEYAGEHCEDCSECEIGQALCRQLDSLDSAAKAIQEELAARARTPGKLASVIPLKFGGGGK